MRDMLNTKEGYLEIITQNKEFIKTDFDDLQSYDKEDNSNLEKITYTYRSLFDYNFELFETYYSMGNSIPETQKSFLEIIGYFRKCWESEWGYVQIVDMLSLGIMFEIEDSEFDKLVGLVERDNVNDYLIDFLIRYRRPDWQQTDKFLWNKPYKGISEIVKLSTEDKSAALERLKKYLNEWYKSLETKTHESKWNIHTGYWCWEAGALVKILGLDHSGLKDQQYYPYDMVHWKD